jgi:hypothetical protein
MDILTQHSRQIRRQGKLACCLRCVLTTSPLSEANEAAAGEDQRTVLLIHVLLHLRATCGDKAADCAVAAAVAAAAATALSFTR